MSYYGLAPIDHPGPAPAVVAAQAGVGSYYSMPIDHPGGVPPVIGAHAGYGWVAPGGYGWVAPGGYGAAMLMAPKLGVPVSSGVPGCSASGIQQMLNDLGYASPPIAVDGNLQYNDPNSPPMKAIFKAAAAYGIKQMAPPYKNVCNALLVEWKAKHAKSASLSIAKPHARLRVFHGVGLDNPLTKVGVWWAEQTTTTKAMAVGAGVLGVLAIGLVIRAAKTPRTATANRARRRTRKSKSRRKSRRSRSYKKYREMFAKTKSRRASGAPACAKIKSVKSCRCTAPKKYRKSGATKRSDYALPECFMYPIHRAKYVRTAAGRFGKFGRRYPPAVRKKIAARIDRAKRRFRIGEYRAR